MKIYLAGLKALMPFIAEQKPKYILESFHYITQEVYDQVECDGFLLDSGAFTFLSKKSEGINWTEDLDRYVAFIKRNRIPYFFELDIYKIIGLEKTEELRDRLEQSTGVRSIPVWHRHLGPEYLHKLSEEYSYIAFGGFAIKDIKRTEFKYIPQLLRICEKNNCKVHGLGFTNQEGMRSCRFHSVDSSTWNGHRYGKAYVFRKNRLEGVHPRTRWAKQNINFLNVREWMKFAQYAEDYL
jgi:hypothetical protein